MDNTKYVPWETPDLDTSGWDEEALRAHDRIIEARVALVQANDQVVWALEDFEIVARTQNLMHGLKEKCSCGENWA
jgi:hypothetical protein